MKTPSFWDSKNIISDALLPVSWLYGAGAYLRGAITKPVKLSVPVICVGNLTAGGSGKTPVALAIGDHLKQKNIRAFFLSRGYGGNELGPLLVDPAKHDAREVGDEPLLLAQMLPTVVCKDRRRGAEFAISQGASVIIMDDGLQNPSIEKTLSLLVIDTSIGLGNKRLLPAGPLREPLARGFARADAVVVIGGGIITDIPKDMPILQVKLHMLDPGLRRDDKLLAFCGLAYPQKFFSMLAESGADVVETAAFADHYLYSKNDMAKLSGRAKELGATLVTTAKDAARLSPPERGLVTVVNIALTFDRPEQLSALLNHATSAA